jgi:hypothetical protein
MSFFPIATGPEEAATSAAPTWRTAEDAAKRAGRPVYLASAELAGAFPDLAAAEAAWPGLYGDPRFEAVWRDGAWRVHVRFWRPAPPAPVARTPSQAARKPLGIAHTPDQANVLLGQTAELACEPLARTYRTLARARAVWRTALDSGLARLQEVDGGFQVWLSFWRPLLRPGLAAPLAPGERSELAERAAAPLRPNAAQLDPYVGLFEQLAPENPVIVLAEEGDGRTRGE